MKELIYLSAICIIISCQTKDETTENKDTIRAAKNDTIPVLEEALTFGFSNEKGNQVLAFEENTNPALFTQTIDNQGNTTPITFLKTQKGNDGGVNQTYFNFDNCTGQLFAIKGSQNVNKEFTSVLFNETFTKNHQFISVKKSEKPQKIDGKIKLTFENERNRKVKNIWKIASIGDSLSAYIVIFAPKKDSVLASLVLGNNTFIYKDYPALYDAGSTWRVDDGGEFPAESITILAAFINRDKSIEMITDWAGAEGTNIEFMKAKNNRFETIKEASRYWGAN